MRTTITSMAIVCFSVAVLLATLAMAAQGPAPAPGPGQRGVAPAVPGAQGARGRGAPTNFPAQQRPPGDPAVIARGNQLYALHCRSCHSADLRGGELGGTNLLRSALVLNDQFGELIYPVVRDGLSNPGMQPMPPATLSQEEVTAIAAYLHSVQASARGQGSPPPPLVPPVLNVLVGDAEAGRAYFGAKCASCHSPTGDLAGIGSRQLTPTQLQNLWVGGGGGRGANATPIMATVTLPNGQKTEGLVARIDNFIVVLNLPDGSQRSFRREGDNPRVEVHDPRDAHRQLLPVYTDKDIHDVTAYLVTLK